MEGSPAENGATINLLDDPESPTKVQNGDAGPVISRSVFFSAISSIYVFCQTPPPTWGAMSLVYVTGSHPSHMFVWLSASVSASCTFNFASYDYRPLLEPLVSTLISHSFDTHFSLVFTFIFTLVFPLVFPLVFTLISHSFHLHFHMVIFLTCRGHAPGSLVPPTRIPCPIRLFG